MIKTFDGDKCGGEFNIAKSGEWEIKRHNDTKKHKSADTAAATSSKMSSYLNVNSSLDSHARACEGVWAYHIVKENQSFRSSDCSSRIFRSCFKMLKFSSSRTKSEAIVTQVFAPYVKQEILTELKDINFVCWLFYTGT